MIDKQLIKDWIKALRSGDYQQGKNKLRNADDIYCCLGVLCDIYDEDGWEYNDILEEYEYRTDNDVSSELLPKEMKLELKYNIQELVDLNDSLDHTFEYIADFVEKEILPKYE